MLEFVNVSGPTGSKDLQTRRKVRSQAMRDFRRRQREERDALKANKTRVPSPSHSERERAASTGSESTQYSSRAQSARGPSPKPIHLKSQKAGERTFQAQQKQPQRQSTPHIQFETSNQEAFSQWQYDLGPMTSRSDPNPQYWQYSSRDPSPSREPSMWGTETEDPFENPAQLQQMLAFCRSYIHWLRPGVKTEIAGKIIGQAWETRPCPMLLAACCLASVGHLDAVQPNRPGGNYEVYKARVLRDVSRRMKSSTTALSDETLGALACLLSFEMSRGSGEALTHLYGLKSLLRAKGGIESLGTGGLSNMLRTLDLLHALLFECLPVLTNAIEDLRMTASSEDIDPDPDRLPKPLATIIHEHDTFMQTGPAAYVDALQSLRVLRREVGLVLRDELDSTASATDPVPAHETPGNIERYQNALEGFAHGNCVESTEPEAFHFGRCNYYMALLHFNLLVKKVPYRHWSNQLHVEALFDAYQRVKHRTWEALPYLKLTCLCTAAAATTNARIQSFFKAELVRSIYLMGVEEMPRVENFLLRFIKTRDILQRPERLSSPTVSRGHEKNHSDPSFEQEDYFGGQSEYPATTLPLDGYSDWSTAPPAVSYVVSAPLESTGTSWDEEGHDVAYGEHKTPM